MIQYILLGGSLAFGAAMQPGPLQAFLLSRTVANGWRRTLPACVSPLLSDGPIALLALLFVGHLPRAAQGALRAAGGVLLLYLAGAALRKLRAPARPGPAEPPPRTLFQAVLVNLLNPAPYLSWTFVLGPISLAAWHQRPVDAIAFLVTFYGGMVSLLAVFIFLAGTARFLGPRGQRALLFASALILAGLGIYLLIAGITGLTSGQSAS